MPIIEATESEFEIIPEGEIVSARVVEIIPKEFDWGSRLNWRFQVTEGEYEGLHINDGTSPKFSIDPASKLYEWACVLLGRTFELGDKIDTDDLVGLSCCIEVGHKPDKNDPTKMWMRIDTLMPYRGSASAESVFG